MKKHMMLFAVMAAAFISAGCGQRSSTDAERWHTQAQVDMGRPLFAAHCAPCHGDDGQGAENWREPLLDGKYPPPPLNGTGHTFHHAIRSIILTINEGGVPWDGVMPGFEDKLSEEEIDAIIAFFQSKWSPEIYRSWIKMGGYDRK